MPSAARWREPYSVDRSARVESGQEAARRGDAVALHHGRPVVQRGARREQVDEQVVGEPGIERHPGLDERPQPLVALDHHQRAVAPRHQRLAGEHDVVDQHLVRRELRRPAEQRGPAERREDAADLVLEHHDDGKRQVEEHLPQDRGQGDQVERGGDEVGRREDEDSPQHRRAARPLDHDQEEVEQDRHQGDVEEVERRDLELGQRPQRGDERAHAAPASAVATVRNCTVAADVVDPHDDPRDAHQPRQRGQRAGQPRRPRAAPVSAPMNDLRDAPTTTG